MKAIILAAGKGTRLLPLTLETPKTLLKINNKPIIERIIESFPKEIDEVIIVVNHLKEKIKETFGEKFDNRKIIFVEQGEKSGTFGSIYSAKDLFQKGERFLVTNGDDLHDTEEYAECMKYPRSMGVQKKIMPNYYSTQIDSEDYFVGFKPQTPEEKENGAFIVTGVLVLDTDIFNHEGVLLSTGEYGLPQTVLSQIETHPVKVVRTSGWLSINSHQELENAERHLSSK